MELLPINITVSLYTFYLVAFGIRPYLTSTIKFPLVQFKNLSHCKINHWCASRFVFKRQWFIHKWGSDTFQNPGKHVSPSFKNMMPVKYSSARSCQTPLKFYSISIIVIKQLPDNIFWGILKGVAAPEAQKQMEIILLFVVNKTK